MKRLLLLCATMLMGSVLTFGQNDRSPANSRDRNADTTSTSGNAPYSAQIPENQRASSGNWGWIGLIGLLGLGGLAGRNRTRVYGDTTRREENIRRAA
jgi:hypothetical protein